MQEKFPDRMRRLVKEKGTSLERVWIEAYDPSPRSGTSPAQMKKVMRGERAITPHAIEAIARVLDVPPEEFPEYRLALARAQIDPSEVGLDQALKNLERIENALRRRR